MLICPNCRIALRSVNAIQRLNGRREANKVTLDTHHLGRCEMQHTRLTFVVAYLCPHAPLGPRPIPEPLPYAGCPICHEIFAVAPQGYRGHTAPSRYSCSYYPITAEWTSLSSRSP